LLRRVKLKNNLTRIKQKAFSLAWGKAFFNQPEVDYIQLICCRKLWFFVGEPGTDQIRLRKKIKSYAGLPCL